MRAAALVLLAACPGSALRPGRGHGWPQPEGQRGYPGARVALAADGKAARVGLLRCKVPPRACAAEQEQARPPQAHVVVSTFEEDLSWLAEVGVGNVTVYVHDRSGRRTHYGDSPGDQLRRARASQEMLLATNPARARPIAFVDIPNQGDEAAAYLQHIIAHYDALPEVLFFVHGHRCAKHASPDMVALLESRWRCFRPEAGYETLNDPYNQHVCPDMNSSYWAGEKRVVKVRQAWPELFAEEFGAFPQRFCFDSYGQFVVSRERLLSHPVRFYQKLLSGAKDGKTTMEWSWRTLFVPGFL